MYCPYKKEDLIEKEIEDELQEGTLIDADPSDQKQVSETEADNKNEQE